MSKVYKICNCVESANGIAFGGGGGGGGSRNTPQGAYGQAPDRTSLQARIENNQDNSFPDNASCLTAVAVASATSQLPKNPATVAATVVTATVAAAACSS
ncbi:hypothetical protein [Vibrio atypicus]|uniref:hypothetical protein n=1 Tax=Vibrio atypicus TaxID=558271 RepID=UPI001357D8C9|nr:hypothetical protein [Vibrio atypicus]